MSARHSFEQGDVPEGSGSHQSGNALREEAAAELSGGKQYRVEQPDNDGGRPRIEKAEIEGGLTYVVQERDKLWNIAVKSLRAQGVRKPDGEEVRDECLRIVKINEDRYPELWNVRALRSGMVLDLDPMKDPIAEDNSRFERYRTHAKRKDQEESNTSCEPNNEWKKVGPTDGYVVYPCEKADAMQGSRVIAKHDSVVIAHDKSSVFLYPGAEAYALPGSVVYSAGGKVHARAGSKVVELSPSQIEELQATRVSDAGKEPG